MNGMAPGYVVSVHTFECTPNAFLILTHAAVNLKQTEIGNREFKGLFITLDGFE